jgi:glutamine amidotransferase PdxT
LEIVAPDVEEAEVIVVEEVELDVAEEDGLIQPKGNATTVKKLVISLTTVQLHREKVQPEARSRDRAHRLRIHTLSTPTPACKGIH